MAKMTKSQLVASLSEKTGLTKKQIDGFFGELSELAYKEVKKVGEFVVPGFGKLIKAKRKARMGVNPATGAKIKIAAKTVVKFRLAKAAKDAVL
ncbi:MAG: HU family DNA-binding protein [Candidatus Falkowbacteria bacterium]